MDRIGPVPLFPQNLAAAAVSSPSPAVAPVGGMVAPNALEARTRDPEHSFGAVLHQLGARIDAGEKSMKLATSPGAPLDAAQLLSLQVATYRYAEAVELASKLVDKTSSAVKTVLQGQ